MTVMTVQRRRTARTRRRSKRRGPVFRRLCSEQLEPRLLLSCNNGSNDESTGGTLDGQPTGGDFSQPQICLVLNDELNDPDLTNAYSLVPIGAADDTVRYELWLEYTPADAQQMVYFSVDVSTSDDELSGGGAEDYSAFSFAKAAPLLDDWQQIPTADFQSGPLHSSVEYHSRHGRYDGRPRPSTRYAQAWL
jgi:hypothetical protein